MKSKLQIRCEALMEASWLAAVVTAPLFFNLSSSRMFEPDKLYVLYFLAVISGAAWLMKWIDVKCGPLHKDTVDAAHRALLRRPLVVPILIVVGIYTISSLFSLMPADSWLGSYRRSQGTFAFYCYAILFFLVLYEMRTPAQLKRFQFAAILTSIPVSAYSVLQYAGADSIPWSDFMPERSSGTIGNPIFLGAYLILVMPLTFSRLLDSIGMARKDKERRPGFVLAVCCGMALILQFAGLLCTQSRGPVLGLAVAGYLCFFIFLVLKRKPGKKSFLHSSVAVSLGCLFPLLLVLIVRVVSKFPENIALMGLVTGVTLLAAAYVALWRMSWGKSLLWLTWATQTAALLLILAAGPVRILGEAHTIPQIGRWTKLSGASIDARRFLWKTGSVALQSGAPVVLPDDSQDSFYYLRPAIGYGPENIWFPVNLHALPGFVKIHTDADRMHNEMFDQLIVSGFAGALSYLVLFAAAIFYSLRYLGLLTGVRQILLFAVLLVSGCGAGILLPWLKGSPEMASIGLPAGLLAGIFVYIAARGWRHGWECPAVGPREIFLLCILASLIAYFVETSVGIAVVATRTYVFLLLAVLSVLVSGGIKVNNTVKQRTAKPLPWLRSPLPAYIAVACFAVLVESWSFVVNTTAEQRAASLFLHNWFVQSEAQQLKLFLPSNLILLLLTMGAAVALIYGETSNFRLVKKDSRRITAITLKSLVPVWLVMGFLAAVFWTAGDPNVSPPAITSAWAEARITLYLLGLFLILIATAWSLILADFNNYASASTARGRTNWILLPLAAGAFCLIFYLSVRPAWADIACHTARLYERGGNLSAATAIYERASRLAPGRIPYLISLGRAQMNASAADASHMGKAVESLQRALDLNPLDPDTLRNLGILHIQMAERAGNAALRKAQLNKAISYFRNASELAPNHRDVYGDLGRCHFLLGDHKTARNFFEKSIEMYPQYARNYLFLGEMQYRLNDLDEALESFQKAVRLDWRNIEARKSVGFVLSLLGRREKAIQADLKTLEMAPRDPVLLRRLSSLYFVTGDYSSGLDFARRAYDVMPSTDRPHFEYFLDTLQNQAN